jgi:hypothetical protein
MELNYTVPWRLGQVVSSPPAVNRWSLWFYFGNIFVSKIGEINGDIGSNYVHTIFVWMKQEEAFALWLS